MTPQAADGRVWLSKQGGTDGPFSFDEIEEMKAKGEFYHYVYIWGTDDQAWRPLHPVPPPPSLVEAVGESVAPEKTAEPLSKPQLNTGQTPIHPLTVVCHDNRHIIGGVIQKVGPTEGFMKSEDYFATIPPFNKGHWLWINLLDEANGKTENTRAEIVGLSKSRTCWEYQLKWKTVPAILRVLTP